MSGLHAVRRRWGAILVVWLWQLGVGLVLAAPIATAIASTGIGRHPLGDAVLFEPGGLYLVEMVRLGSGALIAAFESALVLYLALGLASLVPIALLFVALARPEKLAPARWLADALAHFPSFFLIGALAWLARALLVLLYAAVYAGVERRIATALHERTADLWLGAGVLVAALSFLSVGIAADLGRAARVRFGTPALASVRTGLRCLLRRPLAAGVAWSIAASWSVATVALAAVLVGLLALEHGSAFRALAAFGVHQLAVIALIGLRALWLRAALELVEREVERTELGDHAVAPMV